MDVTQKMTKLLYQLRTSNSAPREELFTSEAPVHIDGGDTCPAILRHLVFQLVFDSRLQFKYCESRN